MRDRSPGAVLEAFGLLDRRYVHLIGGGGKTALLFAMAHALAEAGRSVITTTTTRILEPRPDESDRVVLGTDATPLVERLRGELRTHRHVTLAASRLEGEGKLRGLGTEDLDRLVAAGVAQHVLVEADGAAGRSLKAHRDQEPVVSARADLVIVVIGVDCLGAPIADRHVHRAALLRERLSRPEGAVLTPEDVARTVLHPEGYLARVGKDSEVMAFVNKAATPEALDRARRLSEIMRGMDVGQRLGRFVVGDVMAGLLEEGVAARGEGA
jgi:probable selenium-dependent hydroxylase accessory protein YqeC